MVFSGQHPFNNQQILILKILKKKYRHVNFIIKEFLHKKKFVDVYIDLYIEFLVMTRKMFSPANALNCLSN